MNEFYGHRQNEDGLGAVCDPTGIRTTNTRYTQLTIHHSSRRYRLLIKYEHILFIYSYISFHFVHSFIWLGELVMASHTVVSLLCPYASVIIGFHIVLLLQLNKNVKLSISWLLASFGYSVETKWLNLAMYLVSIVQMAI